MAGNWRVEPRMWPGPDAKAIELPPATVQRRIVDNALYRLTIGAVEGDRQIVRLFLKEQRPQAKEFLAFEYLYIRQP